MTHNKLLLCLCLLAFLLYHPNAANGPDSSVYLAVAHSILNTGSLNILPETVPDGNVLQVTKTMHAPIHQNIGGVLFILPAAALAQASRYLAGLVPGLPAVINTLAYHEAVWCGFTAYLLALSTLWLLYQVGRSFHSAVAVNVASAALLFGGPLLVYVAVFPCQTNLPAAFLAALLVYLFRFADRGLKRSWLLMGAVWGLGTFIRNEFAVWGVLLLYAVLEQRGPGRSRLRSLFLLGCGGLLFILPGLLARWVLFGSHGSTYGPQLDIAILMKSPLMLFGPRNGLFVFWPILGLALAGYLSGWRRNPPLYHILFTVLLLGTVICGSTVFWSGDFGDSFGQRRFLFLYPVFSLFLARFVDEKKRYLALIALFCFACISWAALMFAAYGVRWSLPDGRTGYLMANDLAHVLTLVKAHLVEFAAKGATLLFLPKHIYALLLLPICLVLLLGLAQIVLRFTRQRLLDGVFIAIVVTSVVTFAFLAGAESRGRHVFEKVARERPQLAFLTRNYEMNYEMIGSMADRLAFFLELGDSEGASRFVENGLRFLQVEAPDQVARFERIRSALQLRRSLGLYRLMPEQKLEELERWYGQASAHMQRREPPPDPGGRYLY